MNAINFPYEIIIADGEDDGAVQLLIEESKKKSNLDIKFYQFNTHGGYAPYYSMIAKAVSLANSKYVMLCDNDDFILPKGVERALHFLEANNEYISAGAEILNFKISNSLNTAYGQDIIFLEPYKYFRIEDPQFDWELQIESIFQDFQPYWYNLYRKESLQTIADELCALDLSDLVAMEFYAQLRTMTLGRSKHIEGESYYLRQRGTSQISSDTNFFKDLIERNLPQDIQLISKTIASKAESSVDIEKAIKVNYANYLTNLLAHTILRYRFPRLFIFKNFLKGLLQSIPNILKKPYILFSQSKIKQKFYYGRGNNQEIKILQRIIKK
jgi:glycosyltransferase domain-containing protein